MGFYQFDEFRKDNFRARLWFVILLHPVDDVTQVIEHGQQQSLDKVFPEVIALIADLLLDHLKVFLEGVNLPLFQTHHGMLAGEEEQGTDVAHVLDDFSEEVY